MNIKYMEGSIKKWIVLKSRDFECLIFNSNYKEFLLGICGPKVLVIIWQCNLFPFSHGLRTHNGLIPNSLQHKFNSQSQINIFDLDIKACFFCRNNGLLMENMDKGLMGADKLVENTPNAPKFICPSSKVWDLIKKRLHWASVVCAFSLLLIEAIYQQFSPDNHGKYVRA